MAAFALPPLQSRVLPLTRPALDDLRARTHARAHARTRNNKAMAIGGTFFAEEHGGHGLWTFSVSMHFEIALSVVLVFGSLNLYGA